MQKSSNFGATIKTSSQINGADGSKYGDGALGAILEPRPTSNSSTLEKAAAAIKQTGSSSSSAQGVTSSAPTKPKVLSEGHGLPPRPIPLGSHSVMVVDGKIVPIGWTKPTGDIAPLLPIRTAGLSAPSRKHECDTPLSGASDAEGHDPQAKWPSSIDMEGSGVSPGTKATELSNSLLESLIIWRASRMLTAGDGKQKPSSFLPEAILQTVAFKCPTSITELQMIPGMTPAKIQKLGTEILDLVRQHLHALSHRQKKRKEASAVLMVLGRTSVTTSSNTSVAARMNATDTSAIINNDLSLLPTLPPVIQDKTSEGDDDSSSSALQLLVSRKDQDQVVAAAAEGAPTHEEPMVLVTVVQPEAHVEPVVLPVVAPNAATVKKRRQRKQAQAQAAAAAAVEEENSDEGDEHPKKRCKKDRASPPQHPFVLPYPGGPAFLNRVSDAALKQYSSEEDRWILKQVAAGMPEAEAAAILRRSRNAIVRRVRLLIARATSAGNVVSGQPVPAAIPLDPAPGPLDALPIETDDQEPLPTLAPSTLTPNPSEEAAAVRAILSARAAAALARSTTSLPSHLRDPLIKYLRRDEGEKQG